MAKRRRWDVLGKASDLISKGYAATPLGKVRIGGWVGDTYERNKADIAAGVGTVVSGGNPLVGAAIKAGMKGAQPGATGRDALRGGLEGYMLGSGVSGAMGGAANAGVVGTSASPSSTSGTDMGFSFGKLGKGLKGMFTGGGDANKKTPWENALAVGTGAYDAFSGYKKDRAAEANDKRMGDYYNRTVDQREAESLRNYGLDAAKEARDARIQSLSEEDRKRILMIMQNRDAELSPVREQLMKAIMGGDSTLFGGSVMKGLGSKGYI